MIHLQNLDSDPVLQGAELLQFLALFQGARWKTRDLCQRVELVAVDPDVTQTQRPAGTSPERYCGPTEIQSVSPTGNDHLDHIGIIAIFCGRRGCQSDNGIFGVVLEVAGKEIDSLGLDQWLVTLDVDDRSGVPGLASRGNAIGAARAFDGCHLGGAAKLLDRVNDSLIVCQNDNSIELGRLLSSLKDVLDQWTAGQQTQRLSGESGRIETGRYGAHHEPGSSGGSRLCFFWGGHDPIYFGINLESMLCYGSCDTPSVRKRSRYWSGFLALVLGVVALVGLQLLLRESIHRFFLPTRQASWIWLANSEELAGPVGFYAVRDFDLEQAPTGASLITATDEEALVFLNSVPIGGTRYADGESLKSYDVGDVVKVGRNRLVVEARSVRGVGGLLMRFAATGPDENVEIVTDRDWRIFRQSEDALFDLELTLPEGESPHVWGQVPVGRWKISPGLQTMPTIAELRTTDRAIFAQRFRLWVVPRRWRDLQKTDRSSPSLGNWVTFDFGQERTSYLALRFPAQVDPESRPLGLLYLGSKPGIDNRSRADAYVVAMPGQRVWLAARPQRFRYATFVGLTPVSGADTYPVDEQWAEQIWPLAKRPVGPFGLPAAQLGPSLEDVVWSELHQLPGFAVGE